MAEYIEREALLQVLEELGGWDDPSDLWAEGYAWGTFSALRRVEDQPTADVVEVRHGKWIKRQFADEPTAFGYSCSKCRSTYEVDTNYCPYCGAKMDGKIGDENGN